MSRTLRILSALWLVTAGSIASSTPCRADASVTINPDVQVSRFAVRLSDLFNGVPADIDRDIAQAPAPCKSAVYDETVLDKLADTYRLDWQSQNASSDHVTVTSACARVTADMIRARVISAIKENSATTSAIKGNTVINSAASAGDDGRSFQVTLDNPAQEIDLPVNGKKNTDPDFTLANFVYDPLNKYFRADLTAQTTRGPYVVAVTGRVVVERPVPILAHRLEAGDTIGADDIDWTKVPEDRITADVVTEESQLVGRELRRDKAEDELFHARDVMPQQLVKRGALVTMRIATPYMTVTAQGKAEQDGAQGDVIRLLNTRSNRVIEGTVTGPDTVDIRTAQQLASAQ